MLKSILSFFLFLLANYFVFSQTEGKFQWVLPLQKGLVPIGTSSTDHLALREGNQVVWLSANGEKKPLPYDSMSYEKGKCWISFKNSLKGIFHAEKGELLPPIYDMVKSLTASDHNWVFEVEKYGMSAVVNDQNQLLLPYKKNAYARLSLVGDTILSYIHHEVYSSVNPDVYYISKTGQKVPDALAKKQLLPEFQRISSNQYVLTNYKNGKTQRDTFVAAEKFVEDIAIVKRDSLWGYLRRDGSWLLKPRFQAALPFDGNGHAVVKSKGKYGVIQKNGTFLIEPTFAFLKPAFPGFFELKENGRLGLVNAAGRVILPPGDYKGFSTAGEAYFAAMSGDSLLIFSYQHQEPVSLPKVLECSKVVFDNNVLIRHKMPFPNTQNYVVVYGLLGPDGKWVIPNVFRGGVFEQKHFIIAEAIIEPCCEVNGLNIVKSSPSKFLIFNRKGEALLPIPVDKVIQKPEAPYLIYTLDKKFGLLTSSTDYLKAEFDELKTLGAGWVIARKGNEWGVLKWVE